MEGRRGDGGEGLRQEKEELREGRRRDLILIDCSVILSNSHAMSSLQLLL